MKGTRRYLVADDLPAELGEYGQSPDGKWWIRPPKTGFPVSSLGYHQVRVHEDGTITVHPSILCEGHGGKVWHGYLERGVWREI